MGPPRLQEPSGCFEACRVQRRLKFHLMFQCTAMLATHGRRMTYVDCFAYTSELFFFFFFFATETVATYNDRTPTRAKYNGLAPYPRPPHSRQRRSSLKPTRMRWAAVFVAPALCQLAAAQVQPAYGWVHAGKTNRPWDKNNPRPKWWDDRLPDSGVIRGVRFASPLKFDYKGSSYRKPDLRL